MHLKEGGKLVCLRGKGDRGRSMPLEHGAGRLAHENSGQSPRQRLDGVFATCKNPMEVNHLLGGPSCKCETPACSQETTKIGAGFIFGCTVIQCMSKVLKLLTAGLPEHPDSMLATCMYMYITPIQLNQLRTLGGRDRYNFKSSAFIQHL